MAEISLTGAVGASPSPNRLEDVKKVQTALLAMRPPLTNVVTVNGTCDPKTIKAIHEVQKRFMTNTDGVVSPDGRTLLHLSDGFVSTYVGCSAQQRVKIDRALIRAQAWLDNTRRAIGGPMNDAVRNKLQNIFHVDVATSEGRARLTQLISGYGRLRGSFDVEIPFVCEGSANAFAAWVVGTDPTMHFASNFFSKPEDDQVAKIIHERAHTILSVGHDGMGGVGEIEFGVAPDDPNKFTWAQASRNAYCWEWLATSLQSSYRADDWR